MEGKYKELDTLLERTSAYSEFLAERLRGADHERRSSKPKRRRTERAKEKSKGTEKLKQLVENSDRVNDDVRRTDVHNDDFEQPAQLRNVELRRYQLAGVEWMVSLYENGLNGILADEMGLGKTLQAIALLCHLKMMGVHGPFLVVGPLSVAPNWEKEFKKFAPSVKTLLYYGARDERKGKREALPTKVDKEYPIVLTTYEIVMRDRSALSRIQWKYIIVDEGHRIKNFDCKLLRELRSYTSANRLILTGTPLQNNLAELWSLLNFLLPEIFDQLSVFKSWFDFESADDVGREAFQREKEEHVVSKLHEILRPFLLRRLKTDVEQVLPTKREIVLYAQANEDQKKYYNAARSGRLHSVLRTSSRRTRQSSSLQNELMQLRKACNHPYLFEEVDEDGQISTETNERLVTSSGKMVLLDRLLTRLLPRGHKVLLFSQFTTMLDIIEDYLGMREVKCCRIDGSTSLQEREERMKKFNDLDSEWRVFLLSTRAGGLGVNLVGADTVIFYDSDLNPQVDLQAMDRCHRIGQTRPVDVYRLVCAGTVEERLLGRATQKRKLEQVVVSAGNFSRSLKESTKRSRGGEGGEGESDELAELLKSGSKESEIAKKQDVISDAELDKLIASRASAADDSNDEVASGDMSNVTEDASVNGRGFSMLSDNDELTT